jgi:predicted nucleic acid-binding Zn ribbon protein
VRRIAPRHLGAALGDALGASTPPGALARVQGAWAGAAGPAIAAASEPVSEREGVVTVACESAVWAHELELLKGDLERRLDARLRFVVRSS